MRTIMRKLYGQQNLTEAEYAQLMDYADDLRSTSPSSYQLFFERFAAILIQDYNTYLPRYSCDSDDFYDYLLHNPALLATLRVQSLPMEVFPPCLHDYLGSAYPDGLVTAHSLPYPELLGAGDGPSLALPEPRHKELICKYESGNPYKEIGLKSHFDRLGRYTFVSRLQSIRYLRGNKASEDKIETVGSDCLGGVFTNKEKSIYYYIFLTEADESKARNACQVLNRALYGN